MPHIQIEYSGNIEDGADIAGLCNALRKAAIEVESFPLPGIRVRAIRADHYSIADGNPGHGFIDISLRLRGGRSSDEKMAATSRLFEAAKSHLAPYMADHSLALSFELRDIDPKLSPKTGTIRDHLKG